MTRLVIVFTLLTSSLLAQVSHVIDEFSNNSNYYSSFNSGSGNIQTYLNNTDFVSGSSSLSLNYTFNGSGVITILRNYSTNTQDLSFEPKSLSINAKHSTNSELIAIRLWEDINMNGSFDGDDEVYISEYHVTTLDWEEFNFDFSNFSKVTGTGNGTLDLNRIRAWDIAIQNNSGTNHSGEIKLDKLSIKANYQPPSNGDSQLTGSFIQLWNSSGCNCGLWSQEQWDAQLEKMKDLCLNKFIVQYSVYHNHSWYSPNTNSFIQFSGDALNKIISAAEKIGIQVYFGLYFDENWNSSNKAISSEYNSLLVKHKNVIDDLYSLFGSSSPFGGWYIPQELNDLEWQNTTEKNLLFNWLKDVSDYAYLKDNNKPVMIAPFFNLWQPADVIEAWYNDLLLTAPHIQEVYPQDGVGIKRKNVEYHVPHFFAAIKKACDNNNREFGATVESFEQLTGWPIDNGSFTAQSGQINQLKKQIWEVNTHSPNDIIQFSWSYMQQETSSSASQLHSDYSAYATCEPTSINPIKNKVNFSFFESKIQFENQWNSIQVFDLNGRLFRNTSKTNFIQIEALKPGAYLVILNKTEIMRIIK